jgi:hypothetical protein
MSKHLMEHILPMKPGIGKDMNVAVNEIESGILCGKLSIEIASSQLQTIKYNAEKLGFNGLCARIDEFCKQIVDGILQAPDNSGINQNWFLIILQERSPRTFKAIKKAIQIKLVVLDGAMLIFNCGKGTVAHIFKDGGFTEWADISRAVKSSKGDLTAASLGTLSNNIEPKEYREIAKKLFVD